MPASEPVAPTVICRSGSTFAYAVTQALNSGRIKVEPVSETVRVAECAANDNSDCPGGQRQGASYTVHNACEATTHAALSSAAGRGLTAGRWVKATLRFTLTDIVLRNDDFRGDTELIQSPGVMTASAPDLNNL